MWLFSKFWKERNSLIKLIVNNVINNEKNVNIRFIVVF